VTLPFEDPRMLTFQGSLGYTLLLGTGVQYEFDWPGPLRNLQSIEFSNGEDYWAYENTSDYVDHLVIVVDSRSDKLLVTQPSDCAILYRANRAIVRSKCKIGENNGSMRPGLSLDRKSTRLNSSHQIISYAVFCLKKKKQKTVKHNKH